MVACSNHVHNWPARWKMSGTNCRPLKSGNLKRLRMVLVSEEEWNQNHPQCHDSRVSLRSLSNISSGQKGENIVQQSHYITLLHFSIRNTLNFKISLLKWHSFFTNKKDYQMYILSNPFDTLVKIKVQIYKEGFCRTLQILSVTEYK